MQTQNTDRDAVGRDERPRVGSPSRVEVALVNHDCSCSVRLVYSRSFSDAWLACRGVRLALELSQRTCRIFVRACEGGGYAMRSRWRFVRFCQILLPRLPTTLFLLLLLRRPDSPLLDVPLRPPRLYAHDSCENIASLLRSPSRESWCIREEK